MTREQLLLGTPANFQPVRGVAAYVNPSDKLAGSRVRFTEIDVTEKGGRGAAPDAHVESERTKRIELMLARGYLELAVQPALGAGKVAAQKIYCVVTQKWLHNLFAFDNKVTVADSVEAALVFINEGAETLEKLYKGYTII